MCHYQKGWAAVSFCFHTELYVSKIRNLILKFSIEKHSLTQCGRVKIEYGL